MAEGNLRRTTRVNAGVPPLRYDEQPGYSGARGKGRPQVSESAHSDDTVVSRDAEIANVEAETATKIAGLESQFDESENDLRMLQIDLDAEKAKLESVEKRLQEATEDEERSLLQAQKRSAEVNISSLYVDVERAKLRVEYKKKKLEREKSVLLKISDRDKKRIMGSDGDGSVFLGYPKTVPGWAKKAAETLPNRDQNPDEYLDQSLQNNSENGGSSSSSSSIRLPENRELEALAAAISRGITRGNKETETLMARQTQGRDLPQFYGKPEEWPLFICAYETSTKQCKYSNSDNLYRLQRALKGEALASVQCLLLSPEAVPKAIEKLKMRYGRPEVIIESLIQKARLLPKIRYENLETLIEFGTTVENLSSIIVSMNLNAHLNNPMLIKELVAKLPPATQVEWVRHCQREAVSTPNVERLSSWVSEYTKAACTLCPPKPKLEENRKRRYEDRAFTLSEEDKSKTRKLCRVCRKSDHKVAHCSEFLEKGVDDRWKYVKANKLCFSCLKFGHSLRSCRSKRPCNVDGCQESHHKHLHRHNPQSPEGNEETSHHAVDSEVYFSVVPAILEGPKGRVKRLVMFDTGSTFTSIDEEISRRIGACGERKSLKVKGYQSTREFPYSRSVNLKISSVDGTFVSQLNNVRTIRGLDLPHQSLKPEKIRKWPNLAKLNLESFSSRPVVLIGLDNVEILRPIESIGGKGNAPIAVRTVLGWTLMGRPDCRSGIESGYHVSTVEDDLHQLVKNSFAIDAIGLAPKGSWSRSREDERAQRILDDSVKRVEDGWECGLLWKQQPTISTSYEVALRRLQLMEKKMNLDEKFKLAYHAKIEDYLSKGYASKVSQKDLTKEKNSFFLPHFMTVNPKKPDKLRFVFDAAAKINGKSLNDYLMKGPDKLISLPGILLKFRKGKYAFTADIQEMFHRVKVNEKDSHFQRFLFRSDPSSAPEVYKMNVLIFGATCSPACAREVKDRNAEEFKNKCPDAYEAIVNKHYVDDYLDSVDDLAKAEKLIQDVIRVQKCGNFNLVNWLANSKELLLSFPENIRAKSASRVLLDHETSVERVLGLYWKPDVDKFTFCSNYLKVTDDVLRLHRLPTKRELLS